MRIPKKSSSMFQDSGVEGDVEDDEDIQEEEIENAAPKQRPKVWRPGVDTLQEDEELQFDPSAYHCLHPFRLNWPCLSFDIMRDALGAQRTEFPHSMFIVAGTQADVAPGNTVAVMRLTNLTKMKKTKSSPEDGDDDVSESSDDEDEEDEDAGIQTEASKKKPIMQVRSVAHHGGVNRIRSMPQQPQICATWGESGHVQVWDMATHVRSLTDEIVTLGKTPTPPPVARQAPLQIFTAHKDEGFAMDWSPMLTGNLLTGDCKAGLHLWEPREGGKWTVDRAPFVGHSGSVEDIQWSPTEGQVFASGSSDQTIAVWDVRTRGPPALSVKAHAADVNVISWNRLASCMLASGADDGTFRIWDLRSFKEDSFVAHFKYHTEPVTSIEWSFHDSSMLATSSADNQLTIWDLSLERDTEEEMQYQAEEEAEKPLAEAPDDLPPQLMFVHQGQTGIKEIHWHPQIPGAIVSTAQDGFNVFKPSNI